MNKLIVLFFLILFPFVSWAGNPEEDQEYLLQKRQAGKLKIGMSADELYKNYEKKLTKRVDLKIEGHYCPAIEINLQNKETQKPSLIAEITQEDKWTVWRIRVYDSRFKTDKGIGVGSTLGDIRKFYKVFWQACGEQVLCAYVKDIQMSFVIDSAFPGKRPEKDDPVLLPDDIIVSSIQISGR